MTPRIDSTNEGELLFPVAIKWLELVSIDWCMSTSAKGMSLFRVFWLFLFPFHQS
jgi:hypothetical protein